LPLFTLYKTFLVTLPKVRELIVLCFIISVATAPSGQQLSGYQTTVKPGNVVLSPPDVSSLENKISELKANLSWIKAFMVSVKLVNFYFKVSCRASRPITFLKIPELLVHHYHHYHHRHHHRHHHDQFIIIIIIIITITNTNTINCDDDDNDDHDHDHHQHHSWSSSSSLSSPSSDHEADARKRSYQWCASLTQTNTKTIGRMTRHCFLRPIRRDLASSSYTTLIITIIR